MPSCSHFTQTNIIILDLLGTDAWKKFQKYSLKWWFSGDLPWYKVKNHLKQIQVILTPENMPSLSNIVPCCSLVSQDNLLLSSQLVDRAITYNHIWDKQVKQLTSAMLF